MSTCSFATSLWRPTSRPLQAKPRQQRGRRQVQVAASTGFRARWSIDVKFGSKADAVALVQEWVRDIGSAAGLTAENTTLNTGSIGAPESTLELEVSFSSLGELETFWSSIPQAQHRAWGQRMEKFIVHGSPQWQVYRCLPAFPEGFPPAAAGSSSGTRPSSITVLPSSTSSSSSPSSSSSRSVGGSADGLLMASEDEVSLYAAEAAAPAIPTTREQTASGLSVVSSEEEAQVVLDWKGEPMKLNPGDKMPFKFL